MSEPVRVIMWGVPRSRSSIIAKCMDGVPDSKILFQLYSPPFRAGLGEFAPSRKNPSSGTLKDALEEPESSGFAEENSTYPWVKKQMEASYPGKRFIFAKEFAYTVEDKFEYIPKGYRHIFLIREPAKVFQSMKRVLPDISAMRGQPIQGTGGGEFHLDKQPAVFLGHNWTFKEAVILYEYLQENNLESDPIIVDSDELVNDPAAVLSRLFEKLGVPYHDSILKWEKGTDVTERWVISKDFKNRVSTGLTYKDFRDSTEFFKQKAEAGAPLTGARLPEDVQRCVDFSMPYYLKLYQKRLTV
ncbi:uncharacterized protein LOC119734361 [Patiria miniata]|uniref:Uncharacterized protein n=1 Tax=Patiria miniata TaxID=46514 RepID=A0A914AK40_PATMI|nr:uncharacterized protein LOC119734361 [Patiria miniata]